MMTVKVASEVKRGDEPFDTTQTAAKGFRTGWQRREIGIGRIDFEQEALEMILDLRSQQTICRRTGEVQRVSHMG